MKTGKGFGITDHAIYRWRERGDRSYSIKKAVDEAVPVGLPNSRGTGLLHSPIGVVFVINDKSVTTVLEIKEDLILETENLNQCKDCEYYFDPSNSDKCPWCVEIIKF